MLKRKVNKNIYCMTSHRLLLEYSFSRKYLNPSSTHIVWARLMALRPMLSAHTIFVWTHVRALLVNAVAREMEMFLEGPETLMVS